MTSFDAETGTDGRLHEGRTEPGLLYLVLQLLLVVLIVRLFEVESRRELFAVLAIGAAGWPIYWRLRPSYRSWFFAGLAIPALVVVLGWQSAAIVLGIAAVLIGISCLPIAWGWRVALTIAAGGGLALVRAGSESLFWPVVGSLFMFRLIVYLYETRRLPTRPRLGETVSYFLMLPNVCFVLFPVVDFNTFRQTREDRPSLRTWQTGINWMVLGISHLLLYRALRYWIIPPPRTIDNVNTLLLFLATNYGLYLRVSGQFHLAVGLLHLYGFNLPKTHDWYFLASSFIDIWRRINIYWKDFMSNLIFMPMFFRLRRRLGDRRAVTLAVLCVFVATWLAHSWQIFWLTDGTFPLTVLDGQLWLGAGVVVAINSVFDRRNLRRPRQAGRAFSWRRAGLHTLCVMGTFLVVSLFWARWTNPGLIVGLVEDFGWEYLLDPGQLSLAAGLLSGVFVLGTLAQWIGHRPRVRELTSRSRMAAWRPGVNLAVLTMLFLVTRIPFDAPVSDGAMRVIMGMQSDHFSGTEASLMVQGYYEELNEGSIQAGLLTGRLRGADSGRRAQFMEFTRPRRDVLRLELIPEYQGHYEGSTFTTNQWCMRSPEIEKDKPVGVVRIALVGSSVVMGYGVDDEETFSVLLQHDLNASPELTRGGRRYEVLNFGCGKYYAIHRRAQLQKLVYDFDPDVVVYFSHQDELLGPYMHLTDLAFHGGVDDPCLQNILDEAGVDGETPSGVIQMKMRERAVEITQCCYGQIVADCRARGITPIWVYLPMPGAYEIPIPPSLMIEMAQQAGFEVVDFADWFADYDPGDVKVSSSDDHPSAFGHRLIAQRLLQLFQSRPELIAPAMPDH